MIAQRLPYDADDERAPLRPPSSRVARAAAVRRRTRAKRLRYALLARIVASVGVLTVAVVVYLGLMANVTRMNYELGRSERARLALGATSLQLEQTLAGLRSRDRLAAIAARAGMREPRTFVSVTLPVDRPPSPPSGLAFLTHLP